MLFNARSTAFNILLNIEKNCEYSNIGLDKALSELDCERRDKAFITNLVNGVCERRITLDYNIKRYLSSPKTRLKAEIRTILRMGAYEILFCDGIPSRASVNEYVNITKNIKAVYSVGMVNAVLRRISENNLVLPLPEEKNYLSVKYSFPEDTVQFFKNIYRDNTEKFLEATLRKPKIYGRVNNTKTNFDELYHYLLKDGIEIEKAVCADNAFYFKSSASFMNTDAFNGGLFHIQDLSSQICCNSAGISEGMKIIDVCSAPGGKTYTMSEMLNNTGKIVSCDIYKHKIGLIKQGALRLSLSNITPLLRDAEKDESLQDEFDIVLCDVPCSGFGVISKKSEIKYRSLRDIAKLPELQYSILENSSKLTKKNGRLIYSTCTVNPAENERVVEQFLKNNGNYELDYSIKMPIAIKSDYGYNICNFTNDCDGFFFAPMIRR